MITATLENASIYRPLGPGIAAALDYLQTTDFAALAAGTHHLDGDRLFAIVNDYQTIACPEVELEGHHRYIDVQYLVSGTELIAYAPLLAQTPFREYDEKQDFTLYRGPASFVRLSAGMFCLLYPHDLHMPGLGEPAVAVRKVVVKVMI